MSITVYNVKKWVAMLTGKSILHVPQNVGQCFSSEKVEGYYNDLTQKVIRIPEILETNQLPSFLAENGQQVEFPVGVFQYGLGAYDLYLKTKDQRYLEKFNQCVAWTVSKQDGQGRWNNFFFYFPESPYSAMAQGQAASLLVRAYIVSGDDLYLNAAKKGIDFMIKPIEEGGVTEYHGEDVIFREYTCQETVFNGWVFAWWGLYDFVQVFYGDCSPYYEILNRSRATLERYLPKFMSWYWSKYDLMGRIASPFYHNLHIAQMQAMYVLTNKTVFQEYAGKWSQQQKSVLCRSLAFVIKAIQKILEH